MCFCCPAPPDVIHDRHHNCHSEAMHERRLHPPCSRHVLDHGDASDKNEESCSDDFSETGLDEFVESGQRFLGFLTALSGQWPVHISKFYFLVRHGLIIAYPIDVKFLYLTDG